MACLYKGEPSLLCWCHSWVRLTWRDFQQQPWDWWKPAPQRPPDSRLWLKIVQKSWGVRVLQKVLEIRDPSWSRLTEEPEESYKWNCCKERKDAEERLLHPKESSSSSVHCAANAGSAGVCRSVGSVQLWPEGRFERPHTEEDGSDDPAVEDHEQ